MTNHIPRAKVDRSDQTENVLETAGVNSKNNRMVCKEILINVSKTLMTQSHNPDNNPKSDYVYMYA